MSFQTRDTPRVFTILRIYTRKSNLWNSKIQEKKNIKSFIFILLFIEQHTLLFFINRLFSDDSCGDMLDIHIISGTKEQTEI